jgi:hypothetical protein
MLDEQWEENFARLLDFKGKFGHCKVPQSDGKLGHWVDKPALASRERFFEAR